MSRVCEWFDIYDIQERLDRAKSNPKLDAYADQFLTDIQEKYDQYGDDMFWSEAQESYLQSLAVWGGFRPGSSQEHEENHHIQRSESDDYDSDYYRGQANE